MATTFSRQTLGINNTNRLLLSWGILVSLTAISWWLGGDHGLGPALATVVILMIAFAKAFLVGASFMELRKASAVLQMAFGIWCVLACGVLVAIAVAV